MGETTKHKNCSFGLFDGRDMMKLSKDITLDHCDKKSSHQRLQNQMHKVHIPLNPSAKSHQNKRKFGQCMNDNKFFTTFELISREKYGNQNTINKRSHSSFLSCSPLFKEKWVISRETQEHKTKYCSICRQDYSHLSDFEDTIEGTNLMKQKNMKSQHKELIKEKSGMEFSKVSKSSVNKDFINSSEASHSLSLEKEYMELNEPLKNFLPSRGNHLPRPVIPIGPRFQAEVPTWEDITNITHYNSCSYSHSIETSMKKKSNMEFLTVLRSSINEDFINSSEASHSLCSKKEVMEHNQPLKNFLPFNGNHLSRPVIPIGPRFQAEVPKWEDPTNIKHYNSDNDLKWLGTQIWPMPVITETNAEGIGKGRLDSCSCDFLGSVDCVQQRFGEARELLELDISTTFSSWKFDDMGEDVSKSWTLDEQREFESLIKSNMLSNDKNSWKLTMERFPSKYMKCLVNYYYSVYIPRLENGDKIFLCCR